jgi:hypothetical protein
MGEMQAGYPNLDDLEDEAQEQQELAADALADLLTARTEQPTFEDLAANAIEELFERTITLENVLLAVIQIVSENAHSPAHMADQLNALLVPNEPQNTQSPEEG